MPNQLLLVCSGTFEEAALEDILAAGALLDWLGRDFDTYRSADSVLVARTLYQQSQGNTPFSRQERARASTPGAKPPIPPMNAPAGTPPSPPLEEAAGPRTPFMVGETAAFDLLEAISRSRNARRLLSHPDLKDDVAFCAQRDLFDLVATMDRDGCVTRP